MDKKEYIEREAVIEQIRVIYCGQCNSYNGIRCKACEFDDAMSLMEDAPAADVVEVVHGEWVDVILFNNNRNAIATCSACKTRGEVRTARYEWGFRSINSPRCPSCGAKMDGGKHEKV